MRVWLLVLLASCGRLDFDPVAPHDLTYDAKGGIVVFNDRAPAKTHPVEIAARVFGLATSFSIVPDIAALTGLDFDPETGGIAGRASLVTPPTAYTVTAESELGLTTTSFSLRTHPGFAVTTDRDVADADLADDDCDDGTSECSLRAAVDQLNAFDPTNRLVILPPGIVTVTNGEVQALNPMEIIGRGRDVTVVDAGKRSRIFYLGLENTVTVSDLTTRNGSTPNVGGCIAATGGSITLARIELSGCTVDGDVVQGAAAKLDDNFSTVVINVAIQDCVFLDNAAIGVTRAEAGALFLGASVPGSTVRIVNTTFENNSLTSPESVGSAIHLVGAASFEVEGSLFAGNTGDAALVSQSGSTGTLTNCTFTGNAGPTGAAIHTNNVSTLTLVNNTIAGNRCTQTCFGGTGVRVNSGGTVTLENTILADNLENGVPSNSLGNVTSNGHNLLDGPQSFAVAAAGDLFSVDPQLDELRDNGGPTHTLAITTGSPALDAGDVSCPARDQRGEVRPARAGCDIGAFELQ